MCSRDVHESIRDIDVSLSNRAGKVFETLMRSRSINSSGDRVRWSVTMSQESRMVEEIQNGGQNTNSSRENGTDRSAEVEATGKDR